MENCKPVSTPLMLGRKFSSYSIFKGWALWCLDLPTGKWIYVLHVNSNKTIYCCSSWSFISGYMYTRRSTSGYVIQFANGTISWSGRKQPTVAISSQLKLNNYLYMYMAMLFNERSWLGRHWWMSRPPSMKTTKEPLSWQRMPNTIADSHWHFPSFCLRKSCF